MTKRAPECEIVSTGSAIFVCFDGKRIAKRGSPGTPQARTWISLEPGFVVFGGDRAARGELVVEYKGVRVQ
jgi:hypothetical protein